MIAKSMIGLSALIAVGVVAIDMAQSRTSDVAPAANLETILTDPVDTLAEIALPARHTSNKESKSDRLQRATKPGCVHEHWPYIADECLVATGKTPVNKPARTINIERRAAATALASR